MKYSEVRERILEASAAGFKKEPKSPVWVRTFYIGKDYRAIYRMSSLELLHLNIPLQDFVYMLVLDYRKQAKERYGNGQRD